jgi:hypothetical protein
MDKKIKFIFVTMIVLALAGCNLPKASPTPRPEVAFTSAAETISAELTRVAPTWTPYPTITPQIVASFTPVPTNTPFPTATRTPLPCNMFKFIDDVTVKDGDDYAPGAVFTKTWRIQNVGACTWLTNYSLAFYQDNSMGGPANIPLLGNVNPSQMVDLSVTLTAPATPGRYTGKWALKDQYGNYFFSTLGNPFWVVIDVIGVTTTVTATPTKTPSGTTTITLNPVALESGLVRSNSTLQAGTLHVGDTAANLGTQLFLSYDISGIPATATINEVKVDYSQGNTIIGAPFTTLRCVQVYQDDYGTLDAGDFKLAVPPGGLIAWCDATALATVVADNDFKSLVQTKLGTTRLQVRVQFPDMITDGNGIEDMIRFGTPKLIITYTP